MASLQHSPRSRLRVQSCVNDNQCVEFVTGLKDQPGQKDSRGQKSDCKFSCRFLCCKCSFCYQVAAKERHKSQLLYTEIKYVKDVSCVGHLSSANLVTNGPPVVISPPVGARLHNLWEKWEVLGSSPKVVTTLREGYTLPFRFRPNLTRSPIVISNYQNPSKQAHLLEALYQLVNKNAVEPVANQSSLGFYNRLFFVSKPNNRCRPVLDLSTLNTFLNTESFKMETPSIYQFTVSPGSTCVFISRAGPTSSKPYPLVCPQHPWSSN